MLTRQVLYQRNYFPTPVYLFFISSFVEKTVFKCLLSIICLHLLRAQNQRLKVGSVVGVNDEFYYQTASYTNLTSSYRGLRMPACGSGRSLAPGCPRVALVEVGYLDACGSGRGRAPGSPHVARVEVRYLDASM